MSGRNRYGGEVLLLPPEPLIIDPVTTPFSHQNSQTFRVLALSPWCRPFGNPPVL